MKHKYQAYAMATQTVAKTRQIVMLYDGAIRCVQQAKEAIRERRIEDRYHLLVRTSDIISGLQGCLDFENGGEVAKALYQFYASLDNRVFSLHRNHDPDICDGIIADLKQMRDVWHEIDRNTNQAATAKENPPASAPGSETSVTFSA